MRIACISTASVPSRTANSIQVMKVCQAYADLDHRVRLWLPGPDPQTHWETLAIHYGLKTSFPITWLRSYRIFRRYDFALQAVLAARFWGADLVHIWTLQAAALSSLLGIATLLEMHDKPPGRFGPRLFRLFIRGSGARRLLPITNALRDWLCVHYNLALEEPFAIISPMGVDLDRFQDLPDPAQARSRLGFPETFTAGYTGHLYEGRGMDLMFQLAGRNPAIRFLWIGGELDAINHWRERAQAAGLENLTLHGFVSNQELPLLQAACDVLMMPYGREISVSSGGNTARFASPMKVFEYLATGRPILSSDLPVLREVLDSSNAILIPPENLEAWDAALKSLQADASRIAALSAAAKKSAQGFTWINRAERSIQGLETK